MQLGRHLQRAKIIVSCRSADYVTSLDGFDTAEIQPLGPADIQLLIAGLLGHDDAEQFYRALQASSASDLAERPLFLIYLAALYKRRGKLPIFRVPSTRGSSGSPYRIGTNSVASSARPNGPASASTRSDSSLRSSHSNLRGAR